MIVYGTRAKEIAKETVFDKCPSCGNANNTSLHVYQKYAHVFWIPFFPIGKTGFSHCGHCQKELSPKEMPASLKLSYDNLKGQAKTPVWTFAGVVLVVLLVVFAIYQGNQKDKKNAALLKTPQTGDVFEVKTGNKQYTLYKVEQVNGDSVFVRLCDYETNKSSGLSDLKKKGDAAYSDGVAGYTKAELQSMLDKGEIIDIDRK